ncbi:MAG: hypothetical protein R3292_10930 [Alcanivorax sp.]|nr:hypothetical protein [Alcanivorax sp.]
MTLRMAASSDRLNRDTGEQAGTDIGTLAEPGRNLWASVGYRF